AVHVGLEAQAAAGMQVALPARAHARPVAGGGAPVGVGRAEVDVAAAAVVVEAGFTRHRAQGGAVCAPHHLGVVLLVGPAAGHDGVAVLHVHRVVVVAPGVFAP